MYLKFFNPLIPHITEEIWQSIGNKEMLVSTNWPVAIDNLLEDNVVTLVVQVNGKLRAKIDMPKDSKQPEVEAAVKVDEKIKTHLEGKEIRKIIYVPNKIVNIVI